MRHLADHDALTGLPNRRRFQDRLARAISRSRRRDEGMALLLLDLDDFKGVNDAYGHDTGDALLCEVARRLRIERRDEDTVARFGGDEFALILRACADPLHTSWIAARIMAELRRPFRYRGQDLHPSGSIGHRHLPGDAARLRELLKHADLALYRREAVRTRRVPSFRSRHAGPDRPATSRRDGHTARRSPPRSSPSSTSRSCRSTARDASASRRCCAGGIRTEALVTATGVPVGRRGNRADRADRPARPGAGRRSRPGSWAAAGVPVGRIAINLADAQFGDGDLDDMVAEILTAAESADRTDRARGHRGRVLRPQCGPGRAGRCSGSMPMASRSSSTTSVPGTPRSRICAASRSTS